MSLLLILFGYRQKYAVGLWQELRTGVSRGVKSVCVRPSIRTIGRSKIFEGASTMNLFAENFAPIDSKNYEVHWHSCHPGSAGPKYV